MLILPTPVSFFEHQRVFRGNLPSSQRWTFDRLLSHAQVTNLELILLSCFALLFFLFNLSYYFSNLRGFWNNTPPSITSMLSRTNAIQHLSHLIIILGHSIWKGSNPYYMRTEDEWVLEPYQKDGGRVSAFINHISRG
jgi:hypothetical protein